MPLFIKIAIRYLFSLKSKTLSFMAVISILGVMLGVAALIVTLSVMNGFMYGIKTKLLQTAPHIMIIKAEGNFDQPEIVWNKLKGIPGIIDYEPFIYTQGLVSKDSNITAVYVRGVDPTKDKDFMSVNKRIVAGDYGKLGKEDTVIIGKDLALSIGVWTGDKINLMSPIGKKTPFGFLPKVKEVEVVAIAEFGIYEYDSMFVMMDLNSAMEFFDTKGGFTGIQVKIKDPFKADIIKREIEKKIEYPYIARSWMDMNKSMFQALELEKLAMFLVITLIVVVASFNISSLLITKSREKRKEIGILRTMGATKNFIMAVFISQGLIIGLIGTFLGVLIGLSIVYIADTYHLVKLNPEVYLIDYLPLKISFLEVLITILASILICFISSVLPARSASASIPAEVIRYE